MQNKNIYRGHRYVPKIMGEWDRESQYEGLSIVTYEGTSYTSKKMVPRGVDILNEEYWAVTGNYNAQVENYRRDVNHYRDEVFEYKEGTSQQIEEYKEGTSQQIEEYKNETTEQVNEFNDTLTQNIEDVYINVKTFGAKGDGVTDDSEAVKKAIAYACSLAEKESANSSWSNFAPTVFFPAGKYIISEAQALNPTVSALKGYNIKGAGYLNSQINYTGEDGYLMDNGGRSWWGFSYIEDIGFNGTGSNNLWNIRSMSGSPQANRFRRVNFHGFNEVITVSFGTHNYNADLFRFESCKASGIKGWIFGIPDVRNSQSVVHTFRDCDFERITGKILYFRSGGTVEVRGGSWIVEGRGRVIETVDGSQSGIGSSNNFFNFYGTKFEYIGQLLDEEDLYPLFYNHSMANITFTNCNFGQFSTWESIIDYYHFGYTDRGDIRFNNCYFPRIMGIKVAIRGGEILGSKKPKVFIRESLMERYLHDMIEIEYLSGNDNVGRGPIIVAEGCTKTDQTPVNTMLNKHQLKGGYEPRKNLYVYRNGIFHNEGIPKENKTFQLPVGAILTNVKVVFQKQLGNGYPYDFEITNHDGSQILVSGQHTPTNDGQGYHSEELSYLIENEGQRTININIDTGSPINAKGFIMFEYY